MAAILVAIVPILVFSSFNSLILLKAEHVFAQKSLFSNQTAPEAGNVKESVNNVTQRPPIEQATISPGNMADKSFVSQNKKDLGKFVVDVQITNNAVADDVGTVHVSIDNTNLSKALNGVNYPALRTITKSFNFSPSDIPVSKGFTVEVIHGNDVFKRAYGINSPSNTPESVNIIIP